MDMKNVFRLRLGAILHFLIGMGHLACLFFLEKAFEFYGILEEMRQLCFGQEWLLYVVTIVVSMGFIIAGLYALSSSGDIGELPLRKLVLIVIVSLYLIRGLVGIDSLLYCFSYLQLFSTLVPPLMLYCYLPGVKVSKNTDYKK